MSTAHSMTHDSVMSTITDGVKPLGGRRANLFAPDSKISDAVLDGFVVPESLGKIPGGKIFIAGCRMHSCIEKSAAIVDEESNKVVAFAIKNFQCHYMPTTERITGSEGESKAKIECETEPLLNIYIIRSNYPPKHTGYEMDEVDILSKWGKTVDVERNAVYIIENSEKTPFR